MNNELQMTPIRWKKEIDAPKLVNVLVFVNNGRDEFYTAKAWKNEFGEWVDIPHLHKVVYWADMPQELKQIGLKVFSNTMCGSYAGGLLIVAANDMEQAHEVALNADRLESVYWDVDIDGRRENNTHCHYQAKDWEEVKGLVYFGEPCVIDEQCYYE